MKEKADRRCGLSWLLPITTWVVFCWCPRNNFSWCLAEPVGCECIFLSFLVFLFAKKGPKDRTLAVVTIESLSMTKILHNTVCGKTGKTIYNRWNKCMPVQPLLIWKFPVIWRYWDTQAPALTAATWGWRTLLLSWRRLNRSCLKELWNP